MLNAVPEHPANAFVDPPLDATEVHADIAVIGEVGKAAGPQVAESSTPVDADPPDAYVPVAVEATANEVDDGTAVTIAPYAGAMDGVANDDGVIPYTRTEPPTESPWAEAVV